MDTRRTLRQRLTDLSSRYTAAIAARDDAIKAAKTERFNVQRLARQLGEARNEIEQLRDKDASNRPPPSAELRDTRRALMLSERARQSFDTQMAHLQAANEAMARELAAGAPTWGVAAS